MESNAATTIYLRPALQSEAKALALLTLYSGENLLTTVFGGSRRETLRVIERLCASYSSVFSHKLSYVAVGSGQIQDELPVGIITIHPWTNSTEMEDSLDEVLLSEIGFVRFVLRSPLASALQRCSVKVRSFQTYVGILAVHPNWRSQGIGRQLLMQAERCAKEAGDTAVCLDVEIANVRACRFYQACGYSIESERKAPFWLRRHKISGLRRMVKEL